MNEEKTTLKVNLNFVSSLIIGIDRLLDMTRTAVNVTGDAAISCVVASSEKKINYNYKK